MSGWYEAPSAKEQREDRAALDVLWGWYNDEPIYGPADLLDNLKKEGN